MRTIKISDSDQLVTQGSKADLFWIKNRITPYFQELRPGIKLPANLSFNNNIQKTIDDFKIKAIGFGNWVTVEDRINYINALILSMYDLNKVLKFNYNLGIERNLSITFGARGARRVLAHYEPGNQLINITRYRKGEESKMYRLLNSGGIGAFAHEYGHFLDYFAGMYLNKDNNIVALTGGRSLSKNRTKGKGKLRELCDELMEMIIWKKPGQVHSPYYNRLIEFISKIDGSGNYFIRRNEIFARAFEAFVLYELRSQNIKNFFLTESKYNKSVYLTTGEVSKIAPKFRELISEIRKFIV